MIERIPEGLTREAMVPTEADREVGLDKAALCTEPVAGAARVLAPGAVVARLEKVEFETEFDGSIPNFAKLLREKISAVAAEAGAARESISAPVSTAPVTTLDNRISFSIPHTPALG
ncbi:hypothetical protein [Rhodoligotrophos ferricapiens]|uniref:hypothetical protein n=1 Tax=Rhodoligotrophos ferricapiens TaxID=3069264 RepID=UPI00315D63BC